LRAGRRSVDAVVDKASCIKRLDVAYSLVALHNKMCLKRWLSVPDRECQFSDVRDGFNFAICLTVASSSAALNDG
jgi:glutaredoxin-related protein